MVGGGGSAMTWTHPNAKLRGEPDHPHPIMSLFYWFSKSLECIWRNPRAGGGGGCRTDTDGGQVPWNILVP